MTRWFNTAGPCEARKHYMLPPTMRLPNLSRLIAQESSFVIHAPRQTSKTTAMQALAQQLTESGSYAAVMVSAEVGNPFNKDFGAAELAILAAWRDKIADRLPKDLQPPTWVDGPPGQRIRANLRLWAQAIKLPLVLFIDEIDSLQDETLISVLRQLRDGYPERPNNFPLCVGLIARYPYPSLFLNVLPSGTGHWFSFGNRFNTARLRVFVGWVVSATLHFV